MPVPTHRLRRIIRKRVTGRTPITLTLTVRNRKQYRTDMLAIRMLLTIRAGACGGYHHSPVNADIHIIESERTRHPSMPKITVVGRLRNASDHAGISVSLRPFENPLVEQRRKILQLSDSSHIDLPHDADIAVLPTL